jgi:aspartyl-tRNA synthetase
VPCLPGSQAGAKIVFLAFRQQTQTLQGVLVISGDKDENKVSKQMLKYAQGITVSRGVKAGPRGRNAAYRADMQSESIVLVEGVIKKAEVKSCTIQDYEISINKVGGTSAVEGVQGVSTR